MKQTFCSILAVLLLLASPVAMAESDTLSTAGKKGKIIAKSSIYGFGGGLVIGVASQVFKRKAKNIFLFGSLGLYAGILTGIYVISTSQGAKPYEGPDTYEDFGKMELDKSEGLMASWKARSSSTELTLLQLPF